LAELCGLPQPEGIEGTSLVPLLEDPQTQLKEAAYTQHPRPAYYDGAPEVMGRSVRTARYRYTEWRDHKSGELVATELYDHDTDPLETVNVAAETSHASAISESQRLYRLGFGK
jgi:iduronate 2-sulfatase